MSKLFGTAGIRGFTNKTITCEMTFKIASVFGIFLKKNQPNKKKLQVAVARDTRYGALMLSKSASAGLMSVGVDVVDLGIVSTGIFCNYVKKKHLAGGFLVTGSHTPYNMIGLMLILKDGSYIPNSLANQIEEMYFDFENQKLLVKPEKIGSYSQVDDSTKIYLLDIFKHINCKKIKNAKLRLVYDPANGTGCYLKECVFGKVAKSIVDVNCKPGPVPGREAEPRARNLLKTAELVKKNKADIGIATDIDADRVLFIDEIGNVISEDVVGAIFADRILKRKKNATIVCPINSSMLIELIVNKHKSKIEYCSPGQPATVEAIKKYNAIYSYEESGKYYFCDVELWPDGIFAALKLLEIMASKKKKLSEIVSEYPKFFQVKGLVNCPDEIKFKVMSIVEERWKNELVENRLKDVVIDGLKRIYKDNSWLLIRKSGTEPLIRVYSDAPSKERAEELVYYGKALVSQVKHNLM